MNTLNMIKKQIDKASALHDAQISHTAYRGIVTKKFDAPVQEVHGKFTYRGQTYFKWLTYKSNMIYWGHTPPFFMEAEQQERLKLIVRNLKSLVEVLESEVYSDVSKYNSEGSSAVITDYDEIFEDDDGYPD